MPRKLHDLSEEPDPWAEGAEPEPEEEGEERPFRNAHRARMDALKALGNRIAKLPPGERRALPMEDELRAEIEALVAAGQRPDRRRVLMRVQRQLAQADLDRLESALAGNTPAAALERRLGAWRARILEGDDQAIQAFVEAHPRADRQAIRALAREARAGGAGAKSAESRLLRQLRDAVHREDGEE